MLGTPGGGELGGCAVADRAVRPALVLVGSPHADDLAGLGERKEVVLVHALFAELAVDALQIRVLRRLVDLYRTQRHAVTVGPAIERVTGELGTLISAQHPRQTVERAYPIEHPSNVLARDAVVDGDIYRFLRVVIDDRQAL